MDLETCGKNILRVLNLANYDAYIVGGYVRDKLVGLTPYDMDIATSALPSEIEKLFEVKHTGVRFNSVTILYDKYEIEITTFRIEQSYKDNRHPEFIYAKTFSEDVYRRDYTINAIAYDSNFNTIDYVNGINDLNNKLIKTVKDPNITFNEDSLRILRGLYLIAKLDFKFDKSTSSSIKKNSYLLQGLSDTRKYNELEKIARCSNNLGAFKEMILLNVSVYLGLKQTIKYIVKHNLKIENITDLLLLGFYFKEDCVNWNLKKEISSPIANALLIKEIDNINLFKYGYKRCDLAYKLNCYIKHIEYDSNYIKEKYDGLVIHKLSELNIKTCDIVNKYPKVKQSELNNILDIILSEIINLKIKNNYDEIVEFLDIYFNIK